MDDLIKAVRKFREERDWEQFHSPKNLSMALMVECAELVEHFQWLSQEQSRNLNDDTKKAVEEEIGDVLIYLLNLADKLDIDCLQAAKKKLAINCEKYPVSLVKGKSKKYDTYP